MPVLTEKQPVLNGVAEDFLPINGTDYVELYVSNSKQAAHFYKTAFGFQSFAYKGLETGEKDIESYVVIQDKIKLVLTSPLHSNSAIGKHIDKHGDGVKVIALWVNDAKDAWDGVDDGSNAHVAPRERAAGNKAQEWHVLGGQRATMIACRWRCGCLVLLLLLLLLRLCRHGFPAASSCAAASKPKATM